MQSSYHGKPAHRTFPLNSGLLFKLLLSAHIELNFVKKVSPSDCMMRLVRRSVMTVLGAREGWCLNKVNLSVSVILEIHVQTCLLPMRVSVCVDDGVHTCSRRAVLTHSLRPDFLSAFLAEQSPSDLLGLNYAL